MTSFMLCFKAAIVALIALPSLASAEIVRVASAKPVAETMDALEAAVKAAGLGVVARIDHAGAAAGVGMDLKPEQLLIFGNPKVGTPAMQADPVAGLFLPLRVVVFEDADGMAWLAYQDPAAMFEGLTIPANAPFIAGMTGALGKLVATAAAN